MVEAVFAIFAAGLIGAVSQRLRASQPVWKTAAIVCLGLPALMVVAQLGVHRAAHTPHVGVGVLASFCFAAASSAFSWYAMRHGALLGGTDSTSLVHEGKRPSNRMVDIVQWLSGVTSIGWWPLRWG